MCHFRESSWSESAVDDIPDVNKGAVRGTILTGTGHKQLEKLLPAMDVPCMSNKTYLTYHNKISEAFVAAAEKEMREVGEKEKQLVIERGDAINGILHIPVLMDGSWMKRSYGSYDSPSGSTIIIDYYTQKVLFLSVRKKYCVLCARSTKLNLNAKEHVCYKNWEINKTSTSMESDIILGGFRCSIEVHC
ncbi:hypothetical protein KM043_015704 [Ampulex compressa]|nr:hypothetical protein KM043_015704 [Ampulex compressa]